MEDQENSNQPTTSDDSFENYYLQVKPLEDCYMNTAVSKFKVVSNCEEEGEVISEKHVNPKSEIGRRSQYSPESIIDFEMGSTPETAMNGDSWVGKGKRRPRNRAPAAPENHQELRKLDEESDAQKEEKLLLKKRKSAVEEKHEDFNGGEIAVINMEMPMKKKVRVRIFCSNQRADKSPGIVPSPTSLAADEKRVDNHLQINTCTISSTISGEADVIKRDDDVINKDVMPKEHKCKICGKSFTSHQALGGHKSSHAVRVKREGPIISKNHKHAFKKQRENGGGGCSSDNNNNQEIHECNMCEEWYGSSKALLMHKRKHYGDNGIGGGSSKDQIFFKSPRRVLDFDLNEPCPDQEIG